MNHRGIIKNRGLEPTAGITSRGFWLVQRRQETCWIAWRTAVRKSFTSFACFLMIIQLSSLRAQEVVYQVKGKLILDTFKPDGTRDSPREIYPYVASVSGDRWLIECTYPEGKAIDLEAQGSDGVDTFSLRYTHFDPKKYAKYYTDAGEEPPDAEVLEEAKHETSSGHVLHGVNPEGPTTVFSIIWMAFASNGFLKENKTLPPLFGDSIRNHRRTYRTAGYLSAEGYVEVMSQWPFLPSKIEYKEKTGVLRDEYSVLEKMEHAGLTLPKQFIFKIFFQGGLVGSQYTGTVEQVSSEELPSYLPKIKDWIHVGDYRYAEVAAACYDVKDGRWPSESDPIVVKAREEALIQYPLGYGESKNASVVSNLNEKGATQGRTRFWFWIIALVAASPLIFWISLRLQGKRRKN